MHDVVIVGIPLLAILAGILLNRSDMNTLRTEVRAEISGLRGEMSGLRGEMNGRFNKVESHLERIDADLRQFST